jgi:hypothetical protein
LPEKSICCRTSCRRESFVDLGESPCLVRASRAKRAAPSLINRPRALWPFAWLVTARSRLGHFYSYLRL